MKNKVYLEGSSVYIAAIQKWIVKFNEVMRTEMYAPVSIVAYYLPGQCAMIGCPLGNEGYQSLGECMRTDYAMFVAAEKTGLIAEGIDAIFHAALDNCGSWSYLAKDIEHILKHSELNKHVSYSDRYCAEALLAGGELYCEHEDLWVQCYRTVQQKLSERQTRGFTYEKLKKD